MQPAPPAEPQNRLRSASPPVPWLSVIQLALSLLGMLGLWSLALLFVLAGATRRVALNAVGGPELLFLFAADLAVAGLLLLPSAAYSFLDLVGRRSTRLGRLPVLLRPTILILLLPAVVWAGGRVASLPQLAWLVLPPLHVLAIGLPVFWLAYLAVRGLPLGSPQRVWGVLDAGLALSPALILVAETLALLVYAVLAGALVFGTSGQLSQLELLLQQLQAAGGSPELVERALAPFMVQPGVILAVLIFGSVVVPLIEELLKPLGVWFLAGKTLSPVDGFAAGALSGAGYAFLESLLLASNTQDWVSVVLVRIGTGVIHIFTAGLVGWGLVSAWQESRYLRLGASLLAAVAIHGLWNSLTLLAGFSAVLGAQSELPSLPLVQRLGEIAPLGLALIAVEVFGLLLGANFLLQRRQVKSQPPGEGSSGDRETGHPGQAVTTVHS